MKNVFQFGLNLVKHNEPKTQLTLQKRYEHQHLDIQVNIHQNDEDDKAIRLLQTKF